MTLEELIYTRLVQEKELAESLAKYEGVPAVFLQKAPDDKAQGWGVSQYPRADYLVDMTADPERHSSGMVSVNVYSDDTGKPPEELAPLVRIALCDVVMQADDGAYCITWARTELFEMNDSQNPNTLVNGCSLTFLLIAFPQQITQAPDPALAMQEFLKRWETDAFQSVDDRGQALRCFVQIENNSFTNKRRSCLLYTSTNGRVAISFSVTSIPEMMNA